MKKFKLVTVLLILTLVVAACGSNSSNNSSNTPAPPAKQETSGDSQQSGGQEASKQQSAEASDEVNLPNQMVWSVYGTSSGTYADVAAIADVLTKEYGTQIRLLPSDTGVGRLTPIRQGTANIARLGEEYIYAFEGDLEFASKDWGPQDLRIFWAPVGPIGLAVREDSPYQTVADLKGKKVPYVLANPSVNNKMEAYLAYGGLTWDDVETVQLSYSEQANAFKSGQIEAIIFNPFGAAMYELESAVKFRWLDLNDDSKEVWDRVAVAAPSVVPFPTAGAAGTKEGEIITMIAYSVAFTAYVDEDEDMIYNLTKAIDKHYEQYKDATVALQQFSIDKVILVPNVVPFHSGAVKYFKDIGVWTEEAEQKNNALIERQKRMQEGWKTFIESAQGDNLAEQWLEWKKQNLN